VPIALQLGVIVVPMHEHDANEPAHTKLQNMVAVAEHEASI
jgi:hypothetical protein